MRPGDASVPAGRGSPRRVCACSAACGVSTPAPGGALVAAAALALALGACREQPQRASGGAASQPPADAGAGALGAGAPPAGSLVVPPADAGPEGFAAAERLALQRVHHPDAPRLRLDLRVDLGTGDALGVRPIAPAAQLLARLGEPAEKRALGDGGARPGSGSGSGGGEGSGGGGGSGRPAPGGGMQLWRWPALGVEATMLGSGAARIAFYAQERPEAGMNLFPGAVLLDGKAFTGKAPHLTLRETVLALGPGTLRIRADPAIRELAARHGETALFLVFDAETLLLESFFVEPLDEALWSAMAPAPQARALWDLEAPEGSQARRPERVEFAQLPAVVAEKDLRAMGLMGAGLPGARAFFDDLEVRFLKPGEALRRVGGGRAAVLRAELCDLVVWERGAWWEARRLTGSGRVGAETAALERVRGLFGAARGGR